VYGSIFECMDQYLSVWINIILLTFDSKFDWRQSQTNPE